MRDFSQVLRMLRGENHGGAARVRFGRGVVGNTTYAFGMLMVGVAAVGYVLRNTPALAVGAIGALIVVFLLYLLGTYIFANKHPESAMLGDTDFLRLKQSQMAARDVPELPEAPVVEARQVPALEGDDGDA